MLATEVVWTECRDIILKRLRALEEGKMWMEEERKQRHLKKLRKLQMKGLQLWEPVLKLEDFEEMKMLVEAADSTAASQCLEMQLEERLVEVTRLLQEALVAVADKPWT